MTKLDLAEVNRAFFSDDAKDASGQPIRPDSMLDSANLDLPDQSDPYDDACVVQNVDKLRTLLNRPANLVKIPFAVCTDHARRINLYVQPSTGSRLQVVGNETTDDGANEQDILLAVQSIDDPGGVAGKDSIRLLGTGSYTVHAAGPHATPITKVDLVQVNRSFFDPSTPEAQSLSPIDSLDLGLSGLSELYDGTCTLLNVETVKALLGDQ
jgi:hypothetical protein